MTEVLILIGVILLWIISVIAILIIKLHRQRQDYQALFESVPCTISIQDREFRIIGYNREFAESFDPTEGIYCYAVYKGRKEKCEICPVSRTFVDGKNHTSEELRINKDGSRKYWIVKTAPVRNAKGEIVAAIEMCLDVTHRKELEEELKSSERKYYAIFDNIPNPVFILDKNNHNILDCNKSMETVYGYAPSEIAGQPFVNFFPALERLHYAFKMTMPAEINQVKHARKDGKTIYVNIKIAPAEYGGHQVLLVMVSDITRRLEAEQQLSQAAKLATLGEMATGVAHELNQPLTVIKMASSFFMKKIKQNEVISPPVFLNMAEKINNNIDRANKIINHMRDFARKSDMNLERVQVNVVLKNAFDIFSQQLKLRKIETIWDIEENLPVITADPGRLEQVFINLLINARDAIEQKWEHHGGTGEVEKKIFIKTCLRNQKVLAEVSDTGTGIPEGIRDKIFEPFFTTKAVGKGTGLGLSISYGIVKDFHGEIRAVANEYGGACFRLEFPIYELTQDAGNGRR
jgi:histidine kinase